MITALMILLLLTAIFLITLVLIQRGRGGGLAGAFGGMGGQSAFGTKAGDTFTKVTIVVAAFWILLCALTVKLTNTSDNKFDESLGSQAPAAEGENITPAPGDSQRRREGGLPPAAEPADGSGAAESGGTSTPEESTQP